MLRVIDGRTGHRYTTAASVVEADPDRYVVLDVPAVDASGRPLPPETSAITDAGAATEAAEIIEA